jgi:tetratricopeptide (TPR) repeat protein
VKYPTLHFGLRVQSISILVVVFVLFSYIVYLFYTPYKAERHFRDGYNNTILKRYKLGIEHLELATKYAPWETHYQSQLSRTYQLYAEQQPSTRLKLHYYHKIISLYYNMIRLDPHSPWFHTRLSAIYLAVIPLEPAKTQRYTDLSLDHAKKAAEKDAQNPMFQLNYASLLHRTNNLEKAKHYYLKTIGYDPRMGEAHYNLADIYRNEGHLDKVLDQYLLLYTHNPDFLKIELAIASTYIELNQKEKAILYLEKAIEKNLEKSALQTLASLYIHTKQWDKAIHAYKRFFDTYGVSESLHPYYIQVLLQSEKNENIITAFHSLSSFTKQFPHNELAKQQLLQLKPYIKFK